MSSVLRDGDNLIQTGRAAGGAAALARAAEVGIVATMRTTAGEARPRGRGSAMGDGTGTTWERVSARHGAN